MAKIKVGLNNMESVALSFGAAPVEFSQVNRKGDVKVGSIVTGDSSRTLDVNTWLPAAAEVFNISRDIRDYIVIPTVSMISGVPNTNGDSVTKQELLRFNPDRGMLAYQTWKAMPTFLEHANKDRSQAKGVIIDVYLSRLQGFRGDLIKVSKLLAFDRTKDASLADDILNRRINTFSHGHYFKAYRCSVCGHISYGQTFCSHTRPRQATYMLSDGRLAYRQCMYINGFEESAVKDPAYVSNMSDFVYDPRKL